MYLSKPKKYAILLRKYVVKHKFSEVKYDNPTKKIP